MMDKQRVVFQRNLAKKYQLWTNVCIFISFFMIPRLDTFKIIYHMYYKKKYF